MPSLGEECKLPPYYFEFFFPSWGRNLTCKTFKDFSSLLFQGGSCSHECCTQESFTYLLGSLDPASSRRRWMNRGLLVLSLPLCPRLPRPQPHPSLLSAQNLVTCTVLKLPFYFMMINNSNLIKESLLKYQTTLSPSLCLGGKGKGCGQALPGSSFQ